MTPILLPALLLPILFLKPGLAHPDLVMTSDLGWEAAGPNDFRGPCPMLNTLANHRYLPHDGKNLTRPVVVGALSTALNIDPSLGNVFFNMALIANPEPNATFFTLDQLNQHNILEHDASLSRSDAYFGNNHVFNKTIFDQTKIYWTGPTLDPNMLANSKISRQLASKAFNPTYSLPAMLEEFSYAEVASPVLVFGDIETGTVDRNLTVYFFENERLPVQLGWRRPSQPLTQEDVTKVVQMLRNASVFVTGPQSTDTKRGLQYGLKHYQSFFHSSQSYAED